MAKKRKSLQRFANDKLYKVYKPGTSRHEAKQREGFNKKSPFIHSTKTMKTYEEVVRRYVDWCIKEKGVDVRGNLRDLDKHAEDYLIQRNEEGKSKHTIKTERAALGRLLDRDVEFDITSYKNTEITRSRATKGLSRNTKVNRENNKLLFAVGEGTGGRRNDLQRLLVSDFKEINGNLYVQFRGSKGGKTRIAPVLDEHKEYLMSYIKNNPPTARLFPKKINTNADIHALRRIYAGNLYTAVKDSPELRERIQRDIGFVERTKWEYEKGIASDVYIGRGNGFKGNRDDIYIVTQALGHNRLDVAVKNYLI